MKKTKRKDTNTIEKNLESLLEDDKILKRLLYLEKEKRHLRGDELVFVGVADIAAYYWCAMKSLYKNREMELEFFAAYLEDRISYSVRLGLIDRWPANENEILEIGDRINLSHINQLLEKESGIAANRANNPRASCVFAQNGTLFVSNTLSQEDFQQTLENMGVPIVQPIEADPQVRGTAYHLTKGEKYPSIRWNFPWGKYIVVGVPDGLTSDFVYEFKTTRNPFLMDFLRPVAHAQADLYGYFFKRSKKRVQIYVVEKDSTKTWDVGVDVKRAEEVLDKFKSLERGSIPPLPKPWKCKNCEFAEKCELRPRSASQNH